jgi:serine/threonine protein kinase
MCFVQWLQQILIELNCHKAMCTLTEAPADVTCASQVCKAVCGLHQREIVHGDLRPANVMWFSSSFSMKLVDFARWSDKGMPTPLNITLTCAAPEVCASLHFCYNISLILTLV